MAKLYVGLSGFSYPDWKGEGKFYPATTKSKDFFSYYCSRFNALEGVGMFTSMPTEKSISERVALSPDGFRLSPKLHQRITHFSRLKPSGFEALKEQMGLLRPLLEAGKQGPILVQLPPNLKRDDALLVGFLEETKQYEGVGWSFDFRNDSWRAAEVEGLLRSYGVGWVAEDTDEADAVRIDTCGQIYVRLRRLVYTDDQLKEWGCYFASKISEGKDVYVYCRHSDVPEPWVWADRLLELVLA